MRSHVTPLWFFAAAAALMVATGASAQAPENAAPPASQTGEPVGPAAGFGEGRRGEKLRQRLSTFDLNGDGGFDAGEIAAMRVASFERLDADADGFISADERAAMDQKRARVAGHLGGAGMDRADGSRLDSLDVDGDGAISQAEFQGDTPAWVERLDANVDGAVSADELAAARAAIGSRR